MNIEAQIILSDLKAKREILSPAVHLRDYWRTYGLMILYGVILATFEFGFPTHTDRRMEWIYLYMFLVIIIDTAIRDGQRAVNRRFDRLVGLLEKRGGL
jgi:hypothetical protein